MIEASFERDGTRSAVISGAYQYDTGQRMRMHGLPSPQELALADDFLSGDIVTMQVHFGFKGDCQTQARLALWEEESGCWMTTIPDAYLQAAQNVYAYVYVSYGVDEAGNGRSKTMYELAFRPISRPAPDNVATSEQWDAWAVRKEEMQIAIDALKTAKGNAEAAKESAQAAAQTGADAARQAQQAAETAQSQQQRMENIWTRWNGMEVRTVELEAGMQATASLGGSTLTLGMPRGANGMKGETGDTGPADLVFSMENGVLTIMPRA